MLILSGIVFFFYVNPKYDDIKVLRAEEEKFDVALNRSQELIAVRDALLAKFNGFSSNDVDRLEKLLPDNVDNVRLILDLDGIAAAHGISLQEVSVAQVTETVPDGDELGPSTSVIGSFDLDFSVTTRYDSFINFIRDIEDSLRVLDIQRINTTKSDVDNSSYDVTIRTYWLQ